MCGIAGLINISGEPVQETHLKIMVDSMIHRGPDGEGLWIDGNVGLGHRRLAILDRRAHGNQPMRSPDGRWVLSYNGEIYNYLEIRKLLEQKGFRFVTETDTEVVLYSLICWGEKAFSLFNGMFALAFWDRKEKKLVVARDRYGVKPLYYAKQGNVFAVSSENKAIRNLPGFRSSINKGALLEYFTFQNTFSNETLFDNIKLLDAGCWMCFDEKGSEIRKEKYWDYEFHDQEQNISHEDYQEELKFLFNQAVKRQLVSDVEVGCYLSGGIDSGLVATVASGNVANMKAFTCGFDMSSASGIELGFDEREKAKAMAAKLGIEQYQFILKSGDMKSCLPSLVKSLEEPRLGQSYPNFYAAKLASSFVSVVLSGIGGDELFGGYPWRYYNAIESNGYDDYVDRYYRYWQRLASNTELRDLFSPIAGEVEHVWTRDIFNTVLKEGVLGNPKDKSSLINASMYFEAKTFLSSLFLVEDKLSMANGLETRVPFMDNDLVNFAMRCPVRLKLRRPEELAPKNENEQGNKQRDYYLQTKEGKIILRKMLNDLLPGGVSENAKQGFSGPDASWFRGESIHFVKNKILSDDARILSFFDKTALTNLVNRHTEGKENRRLLIWSLLYFEEFLEQM
ncbi:MAG: asparagine synthase (glutamine-hydrolyzing) [Paracoccaceae bacterium]